MGSSVPEPQDRRSEIVLKAAELFASKGVKATTVREIADSVGILSGSLYHHFDSKDALVDEILSSFLRELQDGYKAVTAEAADPARALQNLVSVSLQTVAGHPYAAEIYQSDGNYLVGLPRFSYLKSTAREIQKTWLDVISEGVDRGVFRADVEPRVFYRLIRDAVWLSVRWYRPKPKQPIEQFAADIATVFLDGYRTIQGGGNHGSARGRS